MTPRYVVECRQGPNGWLGLVELGEGQHSLATGATKADLLERLARIVARHEGLARANFELVERKRTSVRPSSMRPASMRAARSDRPRPTAWLDRWLAPFRPNAAG